MTITEAGVDTAEFCDAAEGLVKIFGMSVAPRSLPFGATGIDHCSNSYHGSLLQ